MFATIPKVCLRNCAYMMTRCASTSNNVIFVLGAPGSGKGKHSDHLVKKFGGCHVSVGEILREVLFSGTL